MLEPDKIYHGDAFDLLPQVEDGAVDLVVCDGPYGVTANGWDRVGNVQEFNLRLIRIFAEKLKDGGALYLFGKPDCIDFIDYRPYLTLRSRVAWFQPSRLSQGKINYTNNYDTICYFVKGKNPGDVWGDIKQLTYKSKELVSGDALNTVQKPEKLIERLVKASSNPGDLVLDPFAGVGTCPAVCRRLGRRFIGIEQDEVFVEASNARLGVLERELAQRLV